MKKGILMSLLVSAMILLPQSLLGQKTQLTVSGTTVRLEKAYDSNTSATVTKTGTLQGVPSGKTVKIQVLQVPNLPFFVDK